VSALPTAVWINPPATGHAVVDAAGTARVTAADFRGHPLPSPLLHAEALQ